MKRIIWQYWETKDSKPAFVDDLHAIAKKNSGVDVIQVTPDTLLDYIPDIPHEILEIKELAHKADMIRALLVFKHGGMWLDSDAIVLSNLNWLFDLLSTYEFVGFNNTGSFDDKPLNIRINCFLARPHSQAITSWVKSQHAKFPKTEYSWTEVGTDLLDPIISNNRKTSKLLNFDLICPIKWDQVNRFTSKWENSKRILKKTKIVMLSNKSLQERNPRLVRTPLEELSKDESLIADIIKKAIDPNYTPPGLVKKIISNILRLK